VENLFLRAGCGPNKEASRTRDYCVAKGTTQRAARPDPSLRKKRLFGMTSNYPLATKDGQRQSRPVLHCSSILIHASFMFPWDSMKPGTLRFTRQTRGIVFVFVLVGFSFIGLSLAQQPSATPDNKNNTPPAVLPAAQSAGLPAAYPASQAAVSAATGAQANPQTQNSQIPADGTSDQPIAVKLGPGDLIEVNVYNVPELTTKARVSNSGDVYLPLIDYVHVEGLTQEEAQKTIEKRLSDGGFVRMPHVTIFVDEAASQGVTVMGEVGKPGIYPDVVDHKLYEVISEAGGFLPIASRKIAIIRRGQPEPIRIDLPRNLDDDLSGNVDVLPGDTINVPRAPIIYVVGDVGRPSGLLVDNGSLTVLQALALAGGTNHTAKMSGARIIRKTPSGMTETRIQLKKMLEAKTPDVTLQADDILFVPLSGARVIASQTIGAAISAATAVSVYSVHP
jgi:polysaccharide biosynthesis/export protein